MLDSAITSNFKHVKKKRKIDLEGQMFHEKWKDKYFFRDVNGRPVCLICSEPVAVVKENNIKRHYEMHTEKYDKYTGQLRRKKM